MTTYTQLVQQKNQLFTFQATMDGQLYTVVLTWLMQGQRLYVNMYQLDGALVFSRPLLGSLPVKAIEALSWANGTATGTTALPHGYKVGSVVNLTVSGCVPVEYNGIVRALVVDDSTFSYQVATPLDIASQLGGVSYDIDISGGYFQTSTLVYREGSQQFEVSP